MAARWPACKYRGRHLSPPQPGVNRARHRGSGAGSEVPYTRDADTHRCADRSARAAFRALSPAISVDARAHGSGNELSLSGEPGRGYVACAQTFPSKAQRVDRLKQYEKSIGSKDSKGSDPDIALAAS